MAKLLIEMIVITFIMIYSIISLGKYIDDKVTNPNGVWDFFACSLVLILISILDTFV